MTQEQFKKAINDRESQIKNLQYEIDDLKETYMTEHSKFEVGEKVLVIEKPYYGNSEKEHIAFIIRMYLLSDGVIRYWFVKSKKDGSPSCNKLHLSGKDPEVKKLNSEQNPEGCDTTGDDSSTGAGQKINQEAGKQKNK